MRQTGAITPRQRRLIEVLLTGKTISQACQAAGVGRRTYYRWMEQSHFRAALREAEAELLEQTMRRLLSIQDGALEALSDLVADRRLPGARLQAARVILDAVLRFRSATELESRLAELEEQVKQVAIQSEPPHGDL